MKSLALNLNSKAFGPILVFVLGLCVLVLCFLPGLSGGFLLDDFGTLSQLGDLNRIDSLDKLKHFVFSGVTGPGGRPLALLSFVLNSRTWPADPFNFLVTNLVIHVLNAVLCYVLLNQLLAMADGVRNSGKYLPAIVALIWAIHPMQASTVLYIVQRMAMLSALFGLLTLIIFIKARAEFERERNLRAFACLSLSGVAFIAGFFSKESVLVFLPLIILVEVYLIGCGAKCSNRIYKSVVFLVVLPLALVVLAYPVKLLAENILHLYKHGYEPLGARSFTMTERLLTQQRVLGDYLMDILVPKFQSSGVFFDGYPISKSLFEPFSTLIWAMIHASLIVFAILNWKRRSHILFGVCWFYLCHILESTTPMLEIKFDHRNYVALLGPVFVVANFLAQLPRPVMLRAVSSLSLIVLSVILYFSASLWGNPLQASKVWAVKNPSSVRANEYAAKMAYEIEKNDEEAKKYLRKAISLSRSPASELMFIAVYCESYNGEIVDWDNIANRISAEPPNWSLFGTVKALVKKTKNGQCDLLTFEGMSKLSEGYRSNPGYKRNLSSLLIEQHEIEIALYFGKKEEAELIDNRTNETILPLAYKMTRAQIFASNDMQVYAASRLERGIQVARLLANESEFTLRNAEEVLQLIRRDI